MATATMASRRLNVLIGTALGCLTGDNSASSKRHIACDEVKAWSSSYLNEGGTDPSVIANRSTMNRLYVSDLHRLRDVIPQHPKHVPVVSQPGYASGGRVTLRVLTWNINMLCGPDGSASVGSLKRINPDHVAHVISQVNADIVCLQETLDWIPPQFKDYLDSQGVGELDIRMQKLNDHLSTLGYGIMLRSCFPPAVGNPSLVASRVPVSYQETLRLAPEQAQRHGMGEPRSAVYLEASVAGRGDASVGVYAMHLNHMNHALEEGQRAAEIQSLIEHTERRQQRTGRIATIITGDFNQARQQDYSAKEWSVIAAALSKIKQPQNDGVSELLLKAGFICAYDTSPRDTNFGGRASPAFTHWTGTTVDYLYLQQHKEPSKAEVVGSYVVFSDLSDHMPIVTDISVEVPSAPQ
eukprot:TRINITY_DN67274_c0_g1_i1.p1 TRINITY_DN67274_c0_g1~~TRINITY_DN67274_c0_g1_i1.p1  ORF type:complete len:410 (-),score=27.39 TRINITY_DN67274_c0_g1_i1:110-1339(-)